MSEPVDHTSFLVRRDFSYLKLCGEEAQRWLVELAGAKTSEIRASLACAFEMLRRYELPAALELYISIDRALHDWAAEFPSIVHLMQRQRLAALAYYHYLSDDLETAKGHLLGAHRRIELALGCHDFLLPLAVHCTDFIIQRARIARREHDWQEAKRQIGKIRDIHADRCPFCVLDGGREVRLSDLRAFYASLPLDDEQREQAARMLGDTLPLTERIERLEEAVYAQPGMVIPYP